MNWIGLHLFNNDIRPSGHISRPAGANELSQGLVLDKWQAVSLINGEGTKLLYLEHLTIDKKTKSLI